MPPALMPAALRQGGIDGYCVGEPWNSIGVDRGAHIATVKAAIWRSSPEKVLGVTQQWATRNSEVLAALLRALYRAAEWTGNRTNHDAAAEMLAQPAYLHLPVAVIRRGLSGMIDVGGPIRQVPDFFVPFARAATFPWRSHALWFYSQMVRWGQDRYEPARAEAAAATYRPDIYRDALGSLGATIPSASSKVEGALLRETPVGAMRGTLTLGPDGFFDGRIFDPAMLESYLADDRSGN